MILLEVIANLTTDLNIVIDLYAKFLLAFVGIVTPALALYLNSYFINRTKFERLVNTEEAQLKKQIKRQEEIARANIRKVAQEFLAESNKELSDKSKKLEKWKEIFIELNPKTFFIGNIRVLSVSLLFLFVWLLIRTEKFISYKDCAFQLFQLGACIMSVGSCLIHLHNLYKIGVYLIDVRQFVDEINDEIKELKKIVFERPKEVSPSSSLQYSLNFEEQTEERE